MGRRGQRSTKTPANGSSSANGSRVRAVATANPRTVLLRLGQEDHRVEDPRQEGTLRDLAGEAGREEDAEVAAAEHDPHPIEPAPRQSRPLPISALSIGASRVRRQSVPPARTPALPRPLPVA